MLCVNYFDLRYCKFQVDFEVTLPTENSKDKVFKVSKESGLGIHVRVALIILLSNNFFHLTLHHNHNFTVLLKITLYHVHFSHQVSSKFICQTISYIAIRK